MDTRHKNGNWSIPTLPNGNIKWEYVQHALLMDIRDELQRLNNVFSCHNFQRIPWVLDHIVRNTTKKRKARKKTK
jgi:hypothetical protein